MRVLLVDDDIATLGLLEKSISKWGYDVAKARNGREAFEQTGMDDIDILVSDWQMPEMNGLELCQKVRSLKLQRYIYIILISAKESDPDIVRGLQGGVDDYLTKPLNLDELKARLEIGARIITLERELNQKYVTIKRNYYQSIHMFTHLLAIYNKSLGGHSKRVGQIALMLAKKHPDVLPEDYPIVEAAGLLHDIGLIGLPNKLVMKNVTEMNGDEKEAYLTHPERGETILNEVDLLRPVARIVRMHHEQPNGRGFPDGLSAKQVPLAAALVGAASSYDHLAQIEKIPLERIPQALQKYRGYQIAPDLVDLLLEINLEQMEAEARRTYREIDIVELEPGMTMANDLLMRTGAFIMAAGTVIDAVIIEKLKRYHKLGSISRHVFIKK